MIRIAFDVHGTLDCDKDKLLRSILDGCLLREDAEVFIISGPPLEQIEKEIVSLGINVASVTVISVVDWLKTKGIKMWQDCKETWWCEEHDWWASKGVICKEYKIDLVFDDKIQYKKHMPETTRFVLWQGTKDVVYFGKGGKSDEIIEE